MSRLAIFRACLGLTVLPALLLLAACTSGQAAPGETVPVATVALPEAGHAIGSPDAPLTVYQFADFQCPYCMLYAVQVEPRIMRDYVATGKVRYVFVQYPFLGEESYLAAAAAEAAGEQGKFFEYHDRLFEAWNGENEGAFAVPNLMAFAEELGLDMASFSERLQSEENMEAVFAQRASAQAAGVTSTPTLIVGDQVLTGLSEYAAYREAIDRALLAAE